SCDNGGPLLTVRHSRSGQSHTSEVSMLSLCLCSPSGHRRDPYLGRASTRRGLSRLLERVEQRGEDVVVVSGTLGDRDFFGSELAIDEVREMLNDLSSERTRIASLDLNWIETGDHGGD